jgi:hypothetical protein
MSTYYITLGGGHHDTRGRSLMGWYTTIDAETETEARQIYFAKFGEKFSFSYTAERFAGQVEKYGLQYEPFEDMDLCCQVNQAEYLELKRKYEQLLNGEPAA